MSGVLPFGWCDTLHRTEHPAHSPGSPNDAHPTRPDRRIARPPHPPSPRPSPSAAQPASASRCSRTPGPTRSPSPVGAPASPAPAPPAGARPRASTSWPRRASPPTPRGLLVAPRRERLRPHAHPTRLPAHRRAPDAPQALSSRPAPCRATAWPAWYGITSGREMSSPLARPGGAGLRQGEAGGGRAGWGPGVPARARLRQPGRRRQGVQGRLRGGLSGLGDAPVRGAVLIPATRWPC